jgi:hypothetical protein
MGGTNPRGVKPLKMNQVLSVFQEAVRRLFLKGLINKLSEREIKNLRRSRKAT